jgi:phosphate transport system substrate-binding protein
LLFGALAFLAIPACGPRPSTPMEDSLTSGSIRVVSSAEIVDLLEKEKSAFEALYPTAKIKIVKATSSEAIRDLFGARADLAAITRELEPSERSAAVRGRLELEGYGFARDAIVMVVNRGNPVENMAIDGLRRVYDGRSTRWSEFGGPDQAIEPVVQKVGSDMTEAFMQAVLDGQPIQARSVLSEGDDQVLAEIQRRPWAIGYVSLASVARAPRTLRVASLEGLPYWGPDLEAIHDREYPLTRGLNLYVRSVGHPLAKGFVTFVTSRDGQKIVHESGLVPTTVPVRFVRRSPLIGTH